MMMTTTITRHGPVFPPPHAADWICLDIETTAGRPEHAEEWMRRQWTPNKDWTPDTIGKRYKEAFEKKLGRLALLDSAGIAVVALELPGQVRTLLHCLPEGAAGETLTDYGRVIGFASELEMLKGFRSLLAVWCDERTLLVGHNIRAFDLPRLRLAFLRAGLQLPPALGQDQPNFDSMPAFCRAFSVERSEMIGLPEVLDKLGLPNHKRIVDGGQIDELIAKREHETILRYAALDVQAEAEVFLRLTGRSMQLA
jgi:DNA polymerase III epsilon subunit-like protein